MRRPETNESTRARNEAPRGSPSSRRTTKRTRGERKRSAASRRLTRSIARASRLFDTERRARRRYVASFERARERRDEGTTHETITACTRPERRRGERRSRRPTAVPRRSRPARDFAKAASPSPTRGALAAPFERVRRRSAERAARASRSGTSSASPCHESSRGGVEDASGRRDAPPSGGGDGDARARRGVAAGKVLRRAPRARVFVARANGQRLCGPRAPVG